MKEKDKKKICKNCGEEMKCLGNVSGIIYTSYPVQWDDVYVCHKCKTKRIVRERGQRLPDYSYLDEYTN